MTAAPSSPTVAAQQLAESFALNMRILTRQVNGLSHADSLLQPAMRGNCLNWVLGHIAVHRDLVLEALGEERLLDEAARARYDRGSAPILGEGEGVLPLDALLRALNQAQERIAAALTASATRGEAEGAAARQKAAFLHWHETYHLGQTEYLRQLAGTDDQVI